MTELKSERELRYLSIYAAVATLICGLLVWQQMNISGDPTREELLATRNDSGSPTEGRPVTENVFAQSEFTAYGLFLGKLGDDSNVLKIFDKKGKQRLTLQFASGGSSKLEFIDESGEVVYSLPDDKSKKSILLGQDDAINP